MIADWQTIAVIAVFFVAALVRSAVGFGDALIAVPVLAMVMPVEQAAPATVLVSITIALGIFAQDWRHVHFGSAGRLIAWSAPGIPLGLWMVKSLPETAIKAGLGLLIAGFSAYSLWNTLTNKRVVEWKTDRWAWLVGLIAGVLGGAYGMNGPPLAMYGAFRRWPPDRFRATLQAYFLPASIMGMTGYYFAGLWTAAVTRSYVVSLPGVAIAVLLGRVINRKLHPQRLVIYIYAGLVAVGLMLLWQAIR